MKNIVKSLSVFALMFSFVVPSAFAQTSNIGGTNMPYSNGSNAPFQGSNNGSTGGGYTPGGPTPMVSPNFCYDFNRNISSNGAIDAEDLKYLNAVLKLEGYSELTGMPVFPEQAVKNFQAKYASEVLHPVGLSTPSGFVGAATRAKLNKLYGCANKKIVTLPISVGPHPIDKEPTNASVKVISPNGGEIWKAGSTKKITWTSSGLGNNSVSIFLHNANGVGCLIGKTVASSGSFKFRMPQTYKCPNVSSTLAPGKYTATVYAQVPAGDHNVSVKDSSDNFFEIVGTKSTSVNTTEVKVVSPVGGDTWVIGNEYEIAFDYDEVKAEAKRVLVYLMRDTTQNGVHKVVPVRMISMFSDNTKKFKFTPREFMAQDGGGYGGGYRVMVMICSGKETCTFRGASKPFSIKTAATPSDTPVTNVDVVSVKADVTGNGIVNSVDLDEVTKTFGACKTTTSCPTDLNGNGVVDQDDYKIVEGSVETIKM